MCIGTFDNIKRRQIVNSFEIIATRKRTVSYACHAFRDVDACQSGAAIESIFSYARHIFRNNNALQGSTTHKHPPLYTRYTIRDDYARQRRALIESIFTNTLHIFWNGDTRQRRTITECFTPYLRHIWTKFNRFDLVPI